jgi:hypothetical protein
MHYNTANGATPDQSHLKLLYSSSPVTNKAAILSIQDLALVVPPMTMGAQAVATSGALMIGLHVWGVMPHMHMLGRSALVQAGSECLINIPKWDFHWQQLYFFANNSNIYVPAGTTVNYTCTWDNPTSSTIYWGENTSDEMCISFFYTTLF